MRQIKALSLLLGILLIAGCGRINKPFEGTYDQVFIYCGLGYNNLSGMLENNLLELKTDVLPGLSQDKAILAFCHNTAISGNYLKENPPCLMRIYRGEDGLPVTDTLQVYNDISVSASKETLRRVLEDVRTKFPARRYGLLVSSHGTGWIPGNYNSSSEKSSVRSIVRQPETPWPETKAIGNQYLGSRTRAQWIELSDFVDAIPMKMEYIILDTCLSGCVEVAYELKDLCNYLVLSPTEILTDGMRYSHLSSQFFSGEEPDLLQFCEDYYTYYNGRSGSTRAGTITLVDCSKLDALADAFASIVSAHREDLDIKLAESVQRYYYDSSDLRFYYDLEDLVDHLNVTQAESARFRAALEACIPYHAETPAFFDLLLERCCGLSVYIPDPLRTKLNAHYKTLSWNKKTGLVE